MVLRWNIDRVQNIKVNGVKDDGVMSVDDVNYDVMTRKYVFVSSVFTIYRAFWKSSFFVRIPFHQSSEFMLPGP